MIRYYKLVLSSISLIGLLFGWAIQNYLVSVAASCLYAVELILIQVATVKEMQAFKAGTWKNKDNNGSTILSVIDNIVHGVLIVISMFAAQDDEKLFSTPGMIIWLGTLLAYLAFGPLLGWFAGIPMELSLGGSWRVKRRR